MADSVKELLGRWTVDSSSWKDSVDNIRAMLKTQADEDKARAAQNQAATAAALAAMKSQVEAQTAINSAAKQEAAAKKDAASAANEAAKATQQQRAAEMQLANDIMAINRRAAAEAKSDAAAQVRAQKEIEKAALAAARAQQQQGNGHSGVSNQQAVRGVVASGMGRGYRAAEVLASSIPGVAALAQVAFPIAGLSVFVGMIGEGVSKFQEMVQASKEFSDKVKDAFDGLTLSGQTANDKLQLIDDNLKNTIAKLEHKPVNNIAIAIDEARIKTDELAKSAVEAYNEVKKLLDENVTSTFSSLIKGVGNTDSDKELNIKGNFENFARQRANLTSQLTQTQNTPEYLGFEKTARTSKNPGEVKTAQESMLALTSQTQEKINQLLDNQIAYADRAQKAINGNTTVKAGMGTLAGANYRLTHPFDGSTIGSNVPYSQVYGDQSNNNVILDSMRNQAVGYKNTASLTSSIEGDQNRVKQLEDQKRQNGITTKNAEAKLAANKAANAKELEDAKAQQEALGELNEQGYKSGLEDASVYYANKKALADQAYAAQVKDIENNRKAELAELALMPELTSSQRTSKTSVINLSSQSAIAAAGATRDKAYSGADIGEQADSDKQAKEQIQNELASRLAALKLETDGVKQSYQDQLTSGEDYVAASIDLTEKELAAKTDAINKEKALNGQNLTTNIALLKQQEQAYEAAQESIDKIQAGALGTYSQGAANKYSSTSGALSSQLALSQNPASGGSQDQSIALLTQLRDAAAAEASQQQGYLTDAEAGGQKLSAVWAEIVQRMTQAQTAMINYNNQLREATSYSPIAGSTISAGANGLSGWLTSRYAKGALSAAQGGAATLGAAGSDVTNISSGFGNISGSDSMTNNINNFAQGLKASVQALGQFVSSVANAGSASAGALGGGLSGAGLGQATGTSLGANNGPLSGLGQAAGPLGALIGAGLGAALGGIMGQKQEEVEDDINTLTADFKDIMNSYSSNNSSLAQTVINLQDLVTQAQADAASSKKGGSQFTSLIQQYNEQITQLEDQQQQIMTQLQDQLVQISSPQAYQPLISSIQDILQQYTQFVGAAQNTTDLANANNYLTTSLQNLAVGYTQTLQQDQENAIQEALQLNQLYDQRNQLEQQYLQQVQSIQGQGTLTRGVTLAQSKFSQLYNLDVNTSNQLDSINQQIALTQYQVTAAQQVFQLATTKAGLESQLLGLQEQGINLDMQRISAMQNVLAVLAQTGYSLTNLGNVDASDPNQLLTLLLNILATSLGINPGGTNSTTGSASSILDSSSSSAYSVRSSYGYGQFRGTNL